MSSGGGGGVVVPRRPSKGVRSGQSPQPLPLHPAVTPLTGQEGEGWWEGGPGPVPVDGSASYVAATKIGGPKMIATSAVDHGKMTSRSTVKFTRNYASNFDTLTKQLRALTGTYGNLRKLQTLTI